MSEQLLTSNPERGPVSEAVAIEIAGPVVRETVDLSGVQELVGKAPNHDRDQWIERYREAKASEMAAKLHEDWRQTRLREDGSYEPRVKETADKAWVEAHGTDQVDIASTAYSDLPKDWQSENRTAARVVYDLIDNPDTRGMVISAPENPSPVGQRVHEAWLGRNDWAASGDLGVPFDELPPDEQAKDIRQVDIGRQSLGYKK
jgi:hypothetical protein